VVDCEIDNALYAAIELLLRLYVQRILSGPSYSTARIS